MIEVVSGVIVKHGRILLQQRPALKDFGFCWESPGGKVDGNESHHKALGRELREELGLTVGELPERALWSGKFENVVSRPDRAEVFLLFYFVGDRFYGDPMPRERQPGLGWFTPEEMFGLHLAPANARAREDIAKAIRAAK